LFHVFGSFTNQAGPSRSSRAVPNHRPVECKCIQSTRRGALHTKIAPHGQGLPLLRRHRTSSTSSLESFFPFRFDSWHHLLPQRSLGRCQQRVLCHWHSCQAQGFHQSQNGVWMPDNKDRHPTPRNLRSSSLPCQHCIRHPCSECSLQ